MRSYYKEDWHCDCKPESHTIENYIQGLKNVYDTDEVFLDSEKKFIHVNTKSSCVLASNLFQSEFHGLILSSIHSVHLGRWTGLSFLFLLPDTTDAGGSS